MLVFLFQGTQVFSQSGLGLKGAPLFEQESADGKTLTFEVYNYLLGDDPSRKLTDNQKQFFLNEDTKLQLRFQIAFIKKNGDEHSSLVYLNLKDMKSKLIEKIEDGELKQYTITNLFSLEKKKEGWVLFVLGSFKEKFGAAVMVKEKQVLDFQKQLNKLIKAENELNRKWREFVLAWVRMDKTPLAEAQKKDEPVEVEEMNLAEGIVLDKENAKFYGLDRKIKNVDLSQMTFSEIIKNLEARPVFKDALKNKKVGFRGIKYANDLVGHRVKETRFGYTFNRDLAFTTVLYLVLDQYAMHYEFHQGFIVISDSARKHEFFYVTPQLKKFMKERSLSIKGMSKFLTNLCGGNVKCHFFRGETRMLIETQFDNFKKIEAFLLLIDTSKAVFEHVSQKDNKQE